MHSSPAGYFGIEIDTRLEIEEAFMEQCGREIRVEEIELIRETVRFSESESSGIVFHEGTLLRNL